MDRRPETPAEAVAALERGVPLPDGPAECYVGYGILGVSFASGDVLALRRFPVASNGCGYTAVWHRRPDGSWIFHTDARCDQGCTTHFAPALERVAVSPIRLEWDGGWRLSVFVDGGREIAWTVSLGTSWRSRLLNAVASAIPEQWWLSPTVLRAMAVSARAVLGTGRLRLSGRLPSGARYLSNPRRVWTIDGSRAAIRGVDLGPESPLRHRVSLGDFLIPRRPLLAAGPLFIEPSPTVEAATTASPAFADRARRAGRTRRGPALLR